MVYISCVDACPIKPGFRVGIFVICLIGLIPNVFALGSLLLLYNLQLHLYQYQRFSDN